MTNNTLQQPTTWKRVRSIKEFSVIVILLVLIIFACVRSPAFLSISNLRTTAIAFACNGIIAIAMTLALVIGGIVLYVGPVLVVSGACTVVVGHSVV